MPGFIKNARSLGTTKLRRDALAVFEAGLRAVHTPSAVRRMVSREGDVLTVGGEREDLSKARNVYVVAIGKAAFDAAKELEKILGDRITDGIVLDVKGGRLKHMTSRVGTHPFPSVVNRRATGEIVALLKEAGEGDLVIMVVSGGGSALLCWPTELTCSDLALLTRAMMAKGATIEELNTMRKHTSDVLGGQAAAIAFPARVIGLIFSDVPSNDLSMVASGPTFLDPTTVEDAQALLNKYDLLRVCRLPSCKLQETPKDPKVFSHVRNVLAVSNEAAAQAMHGEAERRGYRARILSTTLAGEAREVGQRLAREAAPGEAVIAAGETTVTLLGNGGKGGRNQELALGALEDVPEDGLVASCASDGIDNTPAAGAIADARTRASAARKRLDPSAYLARNDSFHFFKAAGAQIRTGVTGMNVSDLMLALRGKDARKTPRS